MKSITNAQQELNILKNDVIGIFKPHFRDRFELIIKNNANTLDTINITEFGAIQRNIALPRDSGKIMMFEDSLTCRAKNLNEMLDNPFDWNDFINSF